MPNSVGRHWGGCGKPSRPTYTIRPPNTVTFHTVEAGKLSAEFPALRAVTPARDSDCEGAGQTHRDQTSWQGQWQIWFSWHLLLFKCPQKQSLKWRSACGKFIKVSSQDQHARGKGKSRFGQRAEPWGNKAISTKGGTV